MASEGKSTTEWKALVAVILGSIGTALAAVASSGVLKQGTPAIIILGALAAMVTAVAAYIGGRSFVKASEARADAQADAAKTIAAMNPPKASSGL